MDVVPAGLSNLQNAYNPVFRHLDTATTPSRPRTGVLGVLAAADGGEKADCASLKKLFDALPSVTGATAATGTGTVDKTTGRDPGGARVRGVKTVLWAAAGAMLLTACQPQRAVRRAAAGGRRSAGRGTAVYNVTVEFRDVLIWCRSPAVRVNQRDGAPLRRSMLGRLARPRAPAGSPTR